MKELRKLEAIAIIPARGGSKRETIHSIMENCRLSLGTVQLGLDYGINNLLGKPKLEKSLKILDYATSHNIGSFDTAFAYGDAEEIIGIFKKRAHGNGKNIKITSKLKPNIFADKSGGKSKYEIIASEVKKSLTKMNLSSLDGYLLHTPAYIRDEEVVDALKRCKSEGLIKNFGVSIYDGKDAIFAVTKAKVDYIQVPYSVFDQRLDQTDFFSLANKNGTKVFARSAFLQGLIFMEGKNIPKEPKMAKTYLKKFDGIISKYGFSRAQGALLFSLGNAYIDEVVIGVDNLSQLKEDIEIAKSKVDFSQCRDELIDESKDVKDSIVFPSLWSKR
jgi:aryl-alcohol dehydrogenase-like predicted oxidoreductase